jgi:hypothetical protein
MCGWYNAIAPRKGGRVQRRIRIKAGRVEIVAELDGSKTADAIWEALPIGGQVNLWGDEIYFSVPMALDLDNARELVSIGDLGYWPQGPAFCIFFGPTPMSRGQEIRPASAVNVFGRVTGDATVLKQLSSGADIMVEKEAQS